MVGAEPQSQSQPNSAPNAASASAAATAAEEEALKRNTDCVYFLASPLTCKKGSECDYRHSDIARLNPRDCWFWLHGNCLNPKCGFRHPPLDGLLGTQTPTSSGPSLPPVATVPTPASHFPTASSKQGVPCVFFQKGQCLKGDWCQFLHAPSFSGNKSSLMPGIASAAEPATHKKTGPEKSAQEKVPSIDVAKSVKASQHAKPTVEVGPVPPRNEFSINRRIPHSSGGIELHRYANPAPTANGNSVSSIRVQQPHLLDESGSLNIKDADEVSREPSPGFDVLVDDELRDSDYYPSEDQYGISRERSARNEYDVIHSSDYNTDVGNERYQDSLGYDSHESFRHRTSSERVSGGSSYHERRPYSRTDNSAQVDGLDLRYRLAKHKKSNGLRSVISHEHARETHAEDRSYRGFRRDEPHNSMHENSLSSRLRGRIRLPGRSSSPTDREVYRGVDRGRLSPVRAAMTSHLTQGRVRDRIKGRAEEAYNNGGRNPRGLHSRRDMVGDGSTEFAGPKSLAELKNRKNPEPSGRHATDQQPLGKRKHLMLDDHQPSGDDLSFEGPKPLKEILKRKRGETVGTVHGVDSANNEDISEPNNWEEGNETANNESVNPVGNNNETEKRNPAPLNSTLQSVEAEEGLILEDGVEQESEAYEQRDGEYDYEQVGGEDFELYDGENGDAEEEEEYADEDDDDDDFAKKMGVVYS